MAIYVSENKEAVAFNAGELIQDIGTVSVKENLVINGKDYPMYCTFDNVATAIDNIELKKLRAFFDIFENDAANQALETKVASTSQARATNTEVDMDLLLMLPYNSADQAADDNNVAVIENNASTRAIVKGFNTSSGIAYAERYATSRNKSQYHSFTNGDCANFTSQILENGGVGQAVYDSVGSGWWHKTSKNWLGITTHTHSQSWTMADVFTRYFGAGYTTTSNYSFSLNIQAGDFISADFTNDGNWDHMGFVTAKAAYSQSDGYYDYRVAQHTTDYIAWATSSTNGWDKIGGDGGKYARVRR